MGALKHLNQTLADHGLVRRGRGRWTGEGGRRVDASRRRLLIVWPLAAGPARPLSFWSKPASGPGGLATGDLAFDGEIQILGAETDVRRWMNASARAVVRWLLLPGVSALRLRGEHLLLIRHQWRPRLFDTLELLSHPRWNTAPQPAHDPDPRVRALAALHVTRFGGFEELWAVLDDHELPDWIRLEAAFPLFRVGKERKDAALMLRLARRIQELSQGRRRLTGRLSLSTGAGELALTGPEDDSGGQSDC